MQLKFLVWRVDTKASESFDMAEVRTTCWCTDEFEML